MAKGISGARGVVWLPTILACAIAASAHAAPAKTTWTGYLYQGPGLRYSVVDELAQATSVDVIGCDKEWCEVKVGNRNGYLLAEIVMPSNRDQPPAGVLAQPAAALQATSPQGPCFEADQKGGNGGNAKTVFCEKK